MKKVNIKITEGCVDMGVKKVPNTRNQEEAREQGQLEEEISMPLDRDRALQHIEAMLDQYKTNLSAMDDEELQSLISRLSPGEV